MNEAFNELLKEIRGLREDAKTANSPTGTWLVSIISACVGSGLVALFLSFVFDLGKYQERVDKTAETAQKIEQNMLTEDKLIKALQPINDKLSKIENDVSWLKK